MPASSGLRTAFQALYTRVIALHDDIAIQSRSAKSAPPPHATYKLAREIRAEAVRFLKGSNAGPLPVMPEAKTASLADLLTMLGQLRAVLTSYGEATGADRKPSQFELDADRKRSTYRRFAELIVMGVEMGVKARMHAIENGEDPEEAYNEVHTFFYQAIADMARKDGVEINPIPPRVATHGHTYPKVRDN